MNSIHCNSFCGVAALTLSLAVLAPVSASAEGCCGSAVAILNYVPHRTVQISIGGLDHSLIISQGSPPPNYTLHMCLCDEGSDPEDFSDDSCYYHSRSLPNPPSSPWEDSGCHFSDTPPNGCKVQDASQGCTAPGNP